MAAISDNSASKRYLMKVEPGYYNLGSSTLVMKPYVDLEGSGETQTIITRLGTNSTSEATITTNNSELRHLRVEMSDDGTSVYTKAVRCLSTAPRLIHVTVEASGAISSNTGIYLSLASPTLEHCSVVVLGGNTAYGIRSSNSTPILETVGVTVTDGENTNYGLFMEDGGRFIIRDSTLDASGPGTSYNSAVTIWEGSGTQSQVIGSTLTAHGGETALGLEDYDNPVLVVNSRLEATSASFCRGVHLFDTGGTFAHTRLVGRNSASGIGVYCVSGDGSYTVTLDGCTVISDAATIEGDGEYTIRVGASKLSGGAVVPNGASMTCVATYDENYNMMVGGICP
jgi:hypothetical protein